MSQTIVRLVQRVFLVVGICLLVGSAVALVDRSVSSRRALAAFDQSQSVTGGFYSAGTVVSTADEITDFGLWSEKRIREYKASLSIAKQLPMAVLDIKRLRIRVPVFEGTDDLVLNRGLGWIVGTARPGDTGNIGIAGHRDGFFRGLKDIGAGDTRDLQMLGQRAT